MTTWLGFQSNIVWPTIVATPDLAVRHSHDLNHHNLDAAFRDFRPPLYDSSLLDALAKPERRHIEQHIRKWSGSWQRKSVARKTLMSRHPLEDQARATHGGRDEYESHSRAAETQSTLPGPSQLALHLHIPASSRESTVQPSASRPSRALELPPLPRASTFTGGSFPTASSSTTSSYFPRTFGQKVQQVGNESPRKRKISDTGLEGLAKSPASLPPLSFQHQSMTSAPSMAQSPIVSTAGGDHPRSILTPRSPLQRTASLAHLHPPESPVDGRRYPFSPSPGSFRRPSEAFAYLAGSRALSPAAKRQALAFTSAPRLEPSSYPRAQTSPMPEGIINRNQSTSPSTTYTTYSHSGQISPRIYGRHSTGPSAQLEADNSTASFHSHQTKESEPSNGIPLSTSGGPSTYQMMTVQTTSGTVQLPVDVQAASKVADEKRRRNAGASARFRERRKKKEVEASATIRKLEMQAKDMAEDVEHYRRERDYLASVVMQTPDRERHFPRPQSPRLRRPPPGPVDLRSLSDSPSSAMDEGDVDPLEDGPSTRQRSYSFTRLPSVVPTANWPKVNSPAMYHQPATIPPLVPHLIHHMHIQQMAQRSPEEVYHLQRPLPNVTGGFGGYEVPHVNSLPPPIMQAPPVTGPPNPFSHQRYDGPPPPGHLSLPPTDRR